MKSRRSLHYGRAGTGLELQPGMIFTVEPMINAGRAGHSLRSPTAGRSSPPITALSAQWEHTVLVTADGFEVLTVSAGRATSTVVSSEST